MLLEGSKYIVGMQKMEDFCFCWRNKIAQCVGKSIQLRML